MPESMAWHMVNQANIVNGFGLNPTNKQETRDQPRGEREMVWSWAKTEMKAVIMKSRKTEDRFATEEDERRRHREKALASQRSLVSFFIFVKYMSFFIYFVYLFTSRHWFLY